MISQYDNWVVLGDIDRDPTFGLPMIKDAVAIYFKLQ